tara:strand:+ start:6573 stop:6992 length:420 start_codon:yes stop_codon:yes gene_type:complete
MPKVPQHSTDPVASAAEEIAVSEAAAPESSQNADDVVNVIINAMNNNEELQEKLRVALDINNTHARQKRIKRTVSDARQVAAAYGEVTHAPDFVADPPGRITERGADAVATWKQRWLEGNGNNMSEYDLDQLGAEAYAQ